MGDARFEPAYASVANAANRVDAIRELEDEAVVEALAAASRAKDPLLANVLATEAANRVHRLRAVVCHMGEGVVSLDPEGTVRWLNPAAETLLGLRLGDSVGRNFHVLVDHRDPDGHLIPYEECRLLGVAKEGKVVEVEGEYFVRPDSSRLRVSYTSAPLRGRDGDIEGIVVVFRDCGARLAHEAALAEARQIYCSLFENLPIPVVSLDGRGTILSANRAAEEQTGRHASESRGHKFEAFLLPEDASVARALFQQAMQGQTLTVGIRFLHRNGHYVPIRATGVPIRQGGVVSGVHCIFEVKNAGNLPLRLDCDGEGSRDRA